MQIPPGIILALAALAIVLFICYARTGKLWRCIFFSAFSGAGALGAVWLLGHFIAVSLALTPLTVLISLLLGLPGVLSMLLFGLI